MLFLTKTVLNNTELSNGVPQGSLRESLLFIIFENDIFSCFSISNHIIKTINTIKKKSFLLN